MRLKLYKKKSQSNQCSCGLRLRWRLQDSHPDMVSAVSTATKEYVPQLKDRRLCLSNLRLEERRCWIDTEISRFSKLQYWYRRVHSRLHG